MLLTISTIFLLGSSVYPATPLSVTNKATDEVEIYIENMYADREVRIKPGNSYSGRVLCEGGKRIINKTHGTEKSMPLAESCEATITESGDITFE